VFVSVECCQVEVFALGWLLFQRSPTDCGESNECDLETSKMRRPWPTLGSSATGGGGYICLNKEKRNIDWHVGLYTCVIMSLWRCHFGAETCRSWLCHKWCITEFIHVFRMVYWLSEHALYE
jgi:hypothetical protein